MDKWKQLDKAIRIATIAHSNQFDKGGKPYILHPLHLMNQLMFDPELATIAVLHDVIEDSGYTIEFFIEEGYSRRVTDALQLLTHDPKEPYEDYISKIAINYDTVRVKRKDLHHNSDITRLKGVTEKDLKRMEKYHKAFLFLGEAKRVLK
jgi:(p)ppGpp synthase/HD superfamily hydrolase